MDTCETCRWWGRERAHDDNMPIGSCRVKSPHHPGDQGWTAFADPNGDRTKQVYLPRGTWPWTAFDDWCGEHSPRDGD